MSSRLLTRHRRKAALIVLAAGAAAIGSGGAQAVPRPSSCPVAGNSKAPFYGVTASHVGHGKELHVGGNYRLKQRNRRLTLVETGESSDILKLRLRSSRSSGLAAGCPHFGGSFEAAASVQKVRITDWKSNSITVRVGRPRQR
jgi:hypothetical protein